MMTRKEVLDELIADYQLTKLDDKLNITYPMVVKNWQNNWARLKSNGRFTRPMSLHMTLRKIFKNRAMFPPNQAFFKILYLALRNTSKRWTTPIANWSGAMN